MKLSRWGWLLLGLFGLGLQACVGPIASEEATTREPVRWILVERRYADVAPRQPGDGIVNPDATVLAFHPLYAEDLTWDIVVEPEDHFVELVSFSPPGPAAPGEIVSATVRVGKAKAGQVYRLSAKASQADVRILGEVQAVVQGGESAIFRFTSRVSGRAGIAVGVERIGSFESRMP